MLLYFQSSGVVCNLSSFSCPLTPFHLDTVLWVLVLWFYKKEGKLYFAYNDKKALFTSAYRYRGYHLWSCQNVCDALSFLLDNIYIRFGTKLYRHIVGIPVGTNCAPLVADLFLFCYERHFIKDLSSDNQADVIKAFD